MIARFQTCAVTVQCVETAAGELDPPLEVDDSEILGQIPVWLRFKFKGGRLAPVAQYHVAGLVHSFGRADMRQVGQSEHGVVDPGVQIAHQVFQLIDAAPHVSHLGHDIFIRLAALRPRLANFAGHRVAAGAKFVAVGDRHTPLGVHGQDLVQAILVLGAPDQGSANGIGITADLFERKHAGPITPSRKSVPERQR